MPTEVTILGFPATRTVRLIKLVRDAACVDLMTAKHLVTGRLPFKFAIFRDFDVPMYLEEVKAIGATFTLRETDPNALEDRRVKAMVEADDKQTSYERCRHMLRAALKEN